MFFLKNMQRIKIDFLLLLEDKQQFKFGVVMTGHLSLFLACFFSHFQLVFIQNRGVLEQLLMVFRTFVMFSILSHVILVFLKHSNSRVF